MFLADISARLDRLLTSGNGVETWTQKLTIGGYDMYVHTCFEGDRLVYLSIQLSGMYEHNIRALIEQVCMDARMMLDSGVISTDDLARSWRGREFEPNGHCPQLVSTGLGAMPRSILDAVGILIQARVIAIRSRLARQDGRELN